MINKRKIWWLHHPTCKLIGVPVLTITKEIDDRNLSYYMCVLKLSIEYTSRNKHNLTSIATNNIKVKIHTDGCWPFRWGPHLFNANGNPDPVWLGVSGTNSGQETNKAEFTAASRFDCFPQLSKDNKITFVSCGLASVGTFSHKLKLSKANVVIQQSDRSNENDSS
ncbi:MAG: hypothetical protein GY845_29255 [Planctomycetes bacterium]|nr:hypothetical protein [Planctomycetota bacterium]